MENDTTQYLDCISYLQKVNSNIYREEVFEWFKDNNIDFFDMTELEMYILYIERRLKKGVSASKNEADFF